MNDIMNNIVNDKKCHNIVNSIMVDIKNNIVNDKKGSQYCDRQTALLISQTAYFLMHLLKNGKHQKHLIDFCYHVYSV